MCQPDQTAEPVDALTVTCCENYKKIINKRKGHPYQTNIIWEYTENNFSLSMDHEWLHIHTHKKYSDKFKNCFTFLHIIALLKLIMKTLLKLINFSFMS